MSNLDTLTNAGLITGGANFSDADKTLIESLTAEEVNSLVSVRRKLGQAFMDRNTSATAVGGAQAARIIGIVF